MELDRLYGNEQLKSKLAAAFRSDRISHSWLITGPEGSGKHTLAAILAAAMQCEGGEDRPCGVCHACRKVFSGVHPDVITVDDEEHAGVTVGVIREARSDLFIRPGEGRRKVYVIPRAGDMNPSSANALLKVLEEPPEYGSYILLANNPQQLLPTIRSRCVELSMKPLDEQTLRAALAGAFPDRTDAEYSAVFRRSGGILGAAKKMLEGTAAEYPQTAKFAAAFASRSAVDLAHVLYGMDKMPRKDFSALTEDWVRVLEEAMTVRAGLPPLSKAAAAIAAGRSAREILKAIGDIRAASARAAGNVNVGTLCAALLVRLK